MAKKKITISDMIDRFGRERIVKALTKRRFTNKKRSEMRKTGQKHMGFMSGGFGIFSKRKNVEAGEPDKKKKINVIGPFPAETKFLEQNYKKCTRY